VKEGRRKRDMGEMGGEKEREGRREGGRKADSNEEREGETGRNRGRIGIPDSGSFVCCPTRYKCI
jgi:hypothetical protein